MNDSGIAKVKFYSEAFEDGYAQGILKGKEDTLNDISIVINDINWVSVLQNDDTDIPKVIMGAIRNNLRSK